MSIASEISRLMDAKDDIAAAIENKGVTVPSETKLDAYSALIDEIAVGGSVPMKKDVNFYDYDGTLVAGYTIAEAQALSALPTSPDHSGDDVPLTFQEWNYSLAHVNATTGKLNVGATYITTDGKTHMRLRLTAVTGYAVPIYFNKSDTSTLRLQLIDLSDDSVVWSTTNSSSGNQNETVSGVSSPGDYDLTWEITSGSGTYRFGGGGSTTTVIGGSTQDYKNTLLAVFIGDNVTHIGNYAFNYCNSLASVTIPSGVISISSSTFDTCYSLTSVTIPSGVISISAYVFRYCYSLASVTIPSGVTSISDNAFYFCYSLTSVTIPSGVTSIRSSAFRYCSSLLEYYLLPTTPPTLLDINAFGNINAICIMHVPSASLSAYQAAANWSTYAAYMVGY